MKCQSKDCSNEVSHYIVWTAPMYVCEDCARRLIGVGQVMGHLTPQHTMRPINLFDIPAISELTEDDADAD